MDWGEDTARWSYRLLFYPLKVAERVDETKDASSFILKVPDTLSETFAYQAGQYLTFEIPWQDFVIQRCYSLSSSPAHDTDLKFTVKRVRDGRGSNWFNDHVQPGETLRVAPPAGRFLLQENSEKPLILCAGGSGITPVASLLKTTLATCERPIQLIYANQNADSVIFGPELVRLAQRWPQQLQCHHHYDDCGRFLDSRTLERLVTGRWDADFYVCGPGPFMDLVEDVLIGRGVTEDRIWVERFVSALDPDREPEEAADSAGDDGPEIRGRVVRITVDGRDFETAYRSGESLLACALADGSIDADIPHSCQQGHCGSCMAVLKAGEVHMRNTQALSKRDLAKGYVLACQSLPLSDEVWIDFDI